MNKKDSFFTSSKFIIILFCTIIALCILDITNTPTRIGFDTIELNPWTNLAITSIFVIFSAVITIRSVLLSMKNQENQRKEDNEKAVLPMGKIEKPSEQSSRREDDATVSVVSKYTKKGKTETIPTYKYIRFAFRNVGVREMYDVSIQFEENEHFAASERQAIAPIIYANDTVIIAIGPITKRPVTGNYVVEVITAGNNKGIVPIDFYIYYSDCYKNKYKQLFQIDTIHDWMKIVDTGKLFMDFENPQLSGFRVLSAPEKI